MGGTVRRRGILAAAGAAIAGMVAKQASAPVTADNGTWTLPYTGSTAATNAYGSAFTVTQNGTYRAIHGISTGGIGVKGESTGSYGVFGISSNSTGVYGQGDGGGNGVYGESVGVSGNGVYAKATGNHAVYGNLYGTTAGTAAVYGYGNGTGTFGVVGTGGSTSGTGVQGQSAQYGVVGQVSNVANSVAVYGQNTSATGSNNIGVYGASNTGYGILGVSSAGAPYSGITGSVFTATGAAFAGGAQQASAYAAYFTGKVNIDGPFLVNGTQRFTLKHADGTNRLVSGALTVEPMVEDFGKGQLANGAATVTLDADFRDVADTSDYHVFLTMYGAAHVLYVATQGVTGFVVRAQDAGAGGTFSYRVVAKPKDTGGKVQRLAKYESPDIKIPGINGEPLPPDAPPVAPMPPKAAAPPAPAPQPRTAPPAASATATPSAPSAPAPAGVQPTTAPAVAPATTAPQVAPPPRP